MPTGAVIHKIFGTVFIAVDPGWSGFVDEIPSIEIPGIALAGLLGRGASAGVWAGTDVTGRAVAVKVFTTPAVQKNAFDEAGALARIEHPNVIKIRAMHRTERAVAVVMDRCATTVAQLVADDGPLRGAQTVGLVDGICRGLAALHSAGLVHGDISPSNVGLTMDGVAQLLDFGASRDPLVLGTPGFGQLDAGRGSERGGGETEFEVEQRMRRLLGAGGQRQISQPTGLERARTDVLAAARVGLFALHGSSDLPIEVPEGRGSVVRAVHAVLIRFCQRYEDSARSVTGADLANQVREVIPPAPILVTVPHGSLGERTVELTQTRRAGGACMDDLTDTSSELEVGGIQDLWSDIRPPAKNGTETKSPPVNRKRSAALFALSIGGLVAIGSGVALGMGAEPTADMEFWQQRVSELGQRRESAIIDLDPGLLSDVNAPASPAANADAALIDFLSDEGVVVTDLTTATTVREVARRGADRVRLLVDTRVVSQQREFISNDESVGIGAARAEKQGPVEQLALDLHLVDGEWLVYDVIEG